MRFGKLVRIYLYVCIVGLFSSEAIATVISNVDSILEFEIRSWNTTTNSETRPTMVTVTRGSNEIRGQFIEEGTGDADRSSSGSFLDGIFSTGGQGWGIKIEAHSEARASLPFGIAAADIARVGLLLFTNNSTSGFDVDFRVTWDYLAKSVGDLIDLEKGSASASYSLFGEKKSTIFGDDFERLPEFNFPGIGNGVIDIPDGLLARANFPPGETKSDRDSDNGSFRLNANEQVRITMRVDADTIASVAVVPEPSTLLLIGCGVLGIFFIQLQRRFLCSVKPRKSV